MSDITAQLETEPDRAHQVGDDRATPKGKKLPGTYRETLWGLTLHDERSLKSADVSLEHFLEKCNERFSPKQSYFQSVIAQGGYIEYFVGWFGGFNIGATLEPRLLRSTADLGISIGLDIYAE